MCDLTILVIGIYPKERNEKSSQTDRKITNESKGSLKQH